jgi:hypothetical protein
MDFGGVDESREAVGAPFGDVERVAVLGRQLHADPAAVGRRGRAEVDRDVEDGTPRAAHQLHLGVRVALVMEPTERARPRVERRAALRDSRIEAVGAELVRAVRYARRTCQTTRGRSDLLRSHGELGSPSARSIRSEDVPGDRPQILIDASTYVINNNGDVAMFRVLLRRVWSRYPAARIRIITNDPTGLTAVDPRVEPIVVGDRRAWQLPVLGRLLEPAKLEHDRFRHADVAFRDAARRISTVLRRAVPDAYWQLVGDFDEASAEGGRLWEEALDSCDAVMLTGGGYFTDAFAEHATYLMSTLEAGLQRPCSCVHSRMRI